MFSSLPSASKIYQNSVKPRQKSASSAKKRRKKVHSSSNQHASILDDSVVSLVSCDQESSIGVINGQKDLFDSSCRHSYERENSSPEISLYSVETSEMNSRSYNSIPEQDNHASILCEIEKKNNRKLSVDLCSKQNEVLSEQLNENEQNNLFESNMGDNSKISDPALMDEKLQEESEAVLSPETVLTDSNQQNLSCNNDCNEDIKFDLMGEKDISEMTFEEVEASIEYESLKESLDKAVQMNETADESIIQPEDLGSNTSMQSSKSQCSVNQNSPDISNVDSVSTAHNIACNEDSSSYTSQSENTTQSTHFDIRHAKSSNDANDVTSVKHEENADSATVVNSEPHMDIILADINGNCFSDNNIDNSKENIVYWTNADSNDQSIEVSITKENSGPIKGHMEFSVRTESPEQSELSCTESVLCEAKDYHQEILYPEKKNSDSAEKSEDFILSSEKPKEDFNMKSSSNISQSFSNLLSEDSQTVVSSRCSSVPEGLHLSKKFVDKQSQSAVLTVLDKATLTADLECEESSEECLSERNSSNEESQNESCEHQLSKNSMSGSEDKGSLWNVLPPLAMVKARSRSYVFGSKGPTGSLLGSDELSRFFPDNQVTVFVGTWNMNGHDPPQSIDDFLLPLAINTLPDIYAIGVQESMQSRLEWEVLLQTTLGPSHVLFTSTSLGVLHLCIFLRRDLIWFCSEPEEASVATRPGTMVKTKGAVAVCFMCFGTSFLFVNSHLTAHEQKLKERLSDYEKIISSLELPKSIPVKNHSRVKGRYR
ncbi:Inositol polyphosphate 5-phosphatase E [Araneus ventricosus]|uniref:Inositol polyphosphate 5-phosphatase E n=1 Tax=Araneus ventricosus TaxID=182803 RepID=A0A4Y2IHS0_ARAVE|nr:Inositol polyphosphate 5-phosphatase E [Araneus ventricosus]